MSPLALRRLMSSSPARPGFAPRSMGYEAIREDTIPIRMNAVIRLASQFGKPNTRRLRLIRFIVSAGVL